MKKASTYYREARDAYAMAFNTGDHRQAMRWYAKAQAAAAIGSLMLQLPLATLLEDDPDEGDA